MSNNLDWMIKHNSMVDVNNFLLGHLGMTWDELKKMPSPSLLCVNHFEENCAKCKRKKNL